MIWRYYFLLFYHNEKLTTFLVAIFINILSFSYMTSTIKLPRLMRAIVWPMQWKKKLGRKSTYFRNLMNPSLQKNKLRIIESVTRYHDAWWNIKLRPPNYYNQMSKFNECYYCKKSSNVIKSTLHDDKKRLKLPLYIKRTKTYDNYYQHS